MSSMLLMDFLDQSIRWCTISSGLSCQSMVDFRKRVVISCSMMAALTDILRLSVNPSIGILRKPSACCITSWESPSLSVPKKKALFWEISNSSSIHESSCGVVAMILYPFALKLSIQDWVSLYRYTSTHFCAPIAMFASNRFQNVFQQGGPVVLQTPHSYE